MSRSTGTGVPVFFKCHKARSTFRGHRIVDGVKLTGRKRPRKKAGGCRRATLFQREYECLDCRYVGWSNHIDLEHLENAKVSS